MLLPLLARDERLKGNPAKIWGCPAAVSENESCDQALIECID